MYTENTKKFVIFSSHKDCKLLSLALRNKRGNEVLRAVGIM
jgi:hypothetical protein